MYLVILGVMRHSTLRHLATGMLALWSKNGSLNHRFLRLLHRWAGPALTLPFAFGKSRRKPEVLPTRSGSRCSDHTEQDGGKTVPFGASARSGIRVSKKNTNENPIDSFTTSEVISDL